MWISHFISIDKSKPEHLNLCKSNSAANNSPVLFWISILFNMSSFHDWTNNEYLLTLNYHWQNSKARILGSSKTWKEQASNCQFKSSNERWHFDKSNQNTIFGIKNGFYANLFSVLHFLIAWRKYVKSLCLVGQSEYWITFNLICSFWKHSMK